MASAIALPGLSADAPAKRIEESSYYSQALKKNVPFAVVLPSSDPPAEGWPTLFLLHGRGRNHLSLIEDPNSRDALLKQPYLIALPMGFDGWYINSPVDSTARYSDALQELEGLIAQNYAVRNDRKGRAILGWSMGGFGALYHATHRPDRYAFAAAIIGLLDFPRREGLPEGQRYAIPEAVFSSAPDIWQTINPRLKMDALRDTGVFLVIGENAFDRTMNEKFLRDALSASIEINTIRLPHAHTFQAVQTGLPLALEAVEKHFAKDNRSTLP